MKTYTLAAVSFILAASVANGCTSSTDSTSSGSSSGGSSSSGGIKQCPPQQTGSATECPQSEIEAYAKCATDNCDAEYKECYGAGYATGDFGGPCGTIVSCSNACECDDNACRQKCVPDQACNTCNQKLGQCITANCKLPCQGETKTCDDLATCCGKITDSTKKTQCQGSYDAVKSQGDVACNSLYAGYAADCE